MNETFISSWRRDPDGAELAVIRDIANAGAVVASQGTRGSVTNSNELVKTLDHRNDEDFRMTIQIGIREQMRADVMGQAAMCETAS